MTGHAARRPSYFAGILGILTALSGALLSMSFIGAEPVIALRQLEDLQRSLYQVLPVNAFDNQPSTDIVELLSTEGAPLRLYRARWSDQPVAFAFEVEGRGYSGPITLLMGVTVAGEIVGVRVLSHSETPGLGDKIEVTKDNWINLFKGLSLGNPCESCWAVKKDGGHFDQFTGATITPRAVVRAVKEGLVLFGEHRLELTQTATNEVQR